jgi:hypothetical protein
MRGLLSALLVVTSPVQAGECAFFNSAGQSVAWDGETTIVVDPLYTDAYICSLTKIPDSNGYDADCGSWSDTLVVGTSVPTREEADIVVWQRVFFWYRCAKDHA